MYAKCRVHGLRVRKEDVRLVLKELDPRGVALRQAGRLRRRRYFSKGPNFIWHLDSYDKLKPYGICINGCIDGYSRKIIWLNAYTTSSDPKLIGGYYMEAVQRLGGCPRLVRAILEQKMAMFEAFSVSSYLLAQTAPMKATWREPAPPINESSIECAEFWMCLFGDLRDNGHFDGGFLDKSLLQFCCMGLIQDELDDTAQVWNAHTIRPSRNLNVPSGRPNVMYAVPDLYRTREPFPC
ncbi:hypothetical protein F7725_019747 [Dissostichus mawsoni]|uniref:Integrase core domain-containing protein n=1 Tax=Dissostichus mawsoni TaxID=36200 RepID=A0A7J5YP28_DISMA|nr:hypothetical protein F7725_019747 [Dissostichus mawsoni]